MRLGIALLVAAMMLAGCNSEPLTTSVPEGADTSTAPGSEASIGVDLPPDEPSLQRADDAGRSPEDSVLALIDALSQSDWETAYSLYATPAVDSSTAAREWAEAAEGYSDFRVLEVRVVEPDSAWVRVAYGVYKDRSSSTTPPVAVDEPGEWWPLHKVDGLWRTQWTPRQ